MDEELFSQLKIKRDEIRSRPTPTGKQPLVCNDAALAELARLRPKTRRELLYVSGLGKTFSEKYGDEFMEILSSYHNNRGAGREVMAKEVKEILKSLEARLVNINRRNRLLYMGKLGARFAVDAVAKDGGGDLSGFKAVEFLKKQDAGARFTVLDLRDGDKKENAKRYNDFRTLEREVQRIKRESGESTLYVGYPFVQGRLAGENFTVRAPLVLFPVKMTVTPAAVTLQLETEKDVVYNAALVLSHYKFSGGQKPLDDYGIEEIRQYKFLDDVAQFYRERGMDMKLATGGIKKFVPYTASAFPKYKPGEFEIVENVIVGRFSLLASALAQDFHKLTESSSVNALINELLRPTDEKNIYLDSSFMGDSADISPPSEHTLNYINDLNISQENVISNIENTDRLVMQGPPGTGKSQAITSIIADFVNEGRNVLMVSQKKAALDVIYSRLGRLSRYAVMIGDTKDKESFYDALSRLFAVSEHIDFDGSKFSVASDRIDEGLSRLDEIAEKIYYDERFGAPMQKIYRDNFSNVFSELRTDDLDEFAGNICLELSDLGYDEIKELRRYFDDRMLLEACKEYYELNERHPWLIGTKPDLGVMDIKRALEQADEVVDAYVRYKSKGFFGRLFGGGDYKRKLNALVNKYFEACSDKELSFFKENPTELYNGLKSYERFRSLRPAMERLSANQKLYFGCLYNVYTVRGGSLSEVNRELCDYISYWYISRFESDGREVLALLETYDITVRDICNLLGVKKRESIGRMKAALSNAFFDNVASCKRRGEMLRMIESKRKRSISAFVNKFDLELFSGIRIWLMTPEAVSEVLPLEDGLFDLVVFDEASQIYIERGLPAIARARRVLIAGDHKQLRPSSLGDGRITYDEDEDESDAALEEESLLDLARFRFPEVMLDYHYRSKYEELIAFSNAAFYKGKINVSPNIARPKDPPISVHKVKNGIWEDRRNLAEAKEVVKLLSEYLMNGDGKKTLGVITFNSSQRDLVQDLLDKECLKNSEFSLKYLAEVNREEGGEDVGLFVKNIENVQGDERDVIIFSTAYAKTTEGKVVRNYGWLNQTGGENRLNVAVSRAKQKIHIVTSITPDELRVDDLKNDGPRIFRKYLEYAYAVSSGNTEAAKQVLSSFGGGITHTYHRDGDFVTTLQNALIRSGLDVERDVGMGDYKLDLAVKDEDGEYLLGIECDEALYASLPAARERDVHRKRYLSARGWKTYRVFSSKWWQDSAAQIEKIQAAVREACEEKTACTE